MRTRCPSPPVPGHGGRTQVKRLSIGIGLPLEPDRVTVEPCEVVMPNGMIAYSDYAITIANRRWSMIANVETHHLRRGRANGGRANQTLPTGLDHTPARPSGHRRRARP